jgi:CHAT domain-containing protein
MHAQGAKELNAVVTRLRRALDPDIASGGVIPAYDVGLAHQLYSQLLVPVESGWKGANSLLVVPHGALGSLPFGLLVTSPDVPRADGGLLFDRYQKVSWLLRQAAITQLPSVNAFITLRRLPPPAANRLMFAGFGDPLFSKAQGSSVEPQRVAAIDTRGGLQLRLRNAPKLEGMNSAELASLPRLPDTNEEIREIARALGVGADTDIYTQARASETNVKTADLSNRRVIAFATHGLVPGELDGLTQPALAMSSPEVTGAKDEDGLLAMDEILALKLNADWVVLSACNTASGDGAGGEAVSGLGRAFFYAGARALLVSNWPVETVSARLIMTDLFHRQARQAQLTRAEALRQTLLALMDGPGAADAAGKAQYSYAHPLFWSPFSLVGDGAGR